MVVKEYLKNSILKEVLIMKTVQLLQHNVGYWYSNDQDMPNHEEEHVCRMISDGYSEGELNDSNDKQEIRGYWRINNT